MDEVCYFCLKPLRQPHRPADRHHRLAKRYLDSKEKRDKTNIRLAHSDCHAAYHRTWDNVRLNRQQFIRYMRSISWGYGIFAPEPMAAD